MKLCACWKLLLFDPLVESRGHTSLGEMPCILMPGQQLLLQLLGGHAGCCSSAAAPQRSGAPMLQRHRWEIIQQNTELGTS